MKQNLFVYGCSFTDGVGCREGHQYHDVYKTDGDLMWTEIIAEKTNSNLFNYGQGLFSNDNILDSIASSFDLIKSGDIVIIEKTFHQRFNIPDLDDKRLITYNIHPERLLNDFYPVSDGKKYTKFEKEAITYVALLMDSDLLTNRYNLRVEFLEKVFERIGVKCIVWELEPIWSNFETIHKLTNGVMDDHHWSYKGHKDFADYLMKKYYE